MRENIEITDEPRTYRMMFERATDAMVVLDDDGHLLSANRAARELGPDLRDLVHRELVPLIAEVRMNDEATAETRVRDREGRLRQIELLGSRIANGRVWFVLRDRTCVRELEAEIAQMRRVDSLGYVTASVVHDFNNMLTPIVCLSAVLANELGRETRAAELANEIRTTAERAAALVRQVMAFARRSSERNARVGVSMVVNEMCALVERVVGEQIELRLALDDDDADVKVDREQLEQVVLNLAANARDAMPSGGSLTIASAVVSLGEDDLAGTECQRAGKYVALSLTDTGVGMTPEIRERIFERFFTTKPPGQGSGLGLATAHRFVRVNGGCISVHSEPQRGTRVTLYLPRAEGAPSRPSPSSIADLPGGDETVLVVDDDAGVRGVVRAVLEDAGYEVIAVASAREAIERVEMGASFDLLLADVVMPGMGGPALAAELAARGKKGRALFMTGHADEPIERSGLDHAMPLLRKAFSPAELLVQVRDALSR